MVDLAIMLSQTTTRLEAPNPATYASSSVVLELAFITNMRSARDFDSTALGDFLDFGDQNGLRAGERLKGVEKRINDQRLHEEEGSQHGDRGQPEVEPPAARATPDVAEPGRPSLHAEAEGTVERVIPDIRRACRERRS